MSKLNHTDTPADVEYATVYLAFELSKAKWQLGVILPGSQKLRRFMIEGGDLAALTAHLATWRAKAAATGKPVRVVSCYEAGYDGHWLHRWLTDQGVIITSLIRRAFRSTGARGERRRTGLIWNN